MHIRILSFDFDGCLFNRSYIDAPYTNYNKHLTDAVITHNQDFLERLKKENEKFSNVTAFIGSNRQSFQLDMANAGALHFFKGSCVSAMQTVCDYLGVNFNPLLLTDIYNSLEPGSACKLINVELETNKWIEGGSLEHSDCPMDGNKVSLIFAQMQAAASAYPDEKIVFDFYDDRLDILNTLNIFYTKHSHMIPPNVLLRLNQYNGSEVELVAEIAPEKGIAFNNYQDIVINMLDSLWNHEEIAEDLRALSNSTPELSMEDQSISADNLEQFAASNTLGEKGKEADAALLENEIAEEKTPSLPFEEQEHFILEPVAEPVMLSKLDVTANKVDNPSAPFNDHPLAAPAGPLNDEMIQEKEQPPQPEEKGQFIAVAEPVTEEKAPHEMKISGVGNPGRNPHGFHNHASRSTINRAPIPAKYLNGSCLSSGSCIVS